MIQFIVTAFLRAISDLGMFTQRSRRPSHGTNDITATSIDLDLSEDHPLEHEEVHVERIRNKRDYRGHLLPGDLVPKAFKVQVVAAVDI